MMRGTGRVVDAGGRDGSRRNRSKSATMMPSRARRGGPDAELLNEARDRRHPGRSGSVDRDQDPGQTALVAAPSEDPPHLS